MNKNDTLKEFGRNLRAERNRAGYSQDGLAEKIGLASGGKHIGKIERGETNTSLLVLISLLKCLNIPFDKLYDINKK